MGRLAGFNGGQADVDIPIGAFVIVRQPAATIQHGYHLLRDIGGPRRRRPVPAIAAHLATGKEVVQGYKLAGQGVMVWGDGLWEEGQGGSTVADFQIAQDLV